jgi:hypothetical protein
MFLFLLCFEERIGDRKSDGKHLLTAEFFSDVHRILQVNGMLTIVTDNLPYATQLAKAFANEQCLVHKFSSKDIVDARDLKKNCDSFGNGIILYQGDPNSTVGHIASSSSYFDRLWQNGKKIKRYILCLISR